MRYRIFLAAVLALFGWGAAAQESGSRFGLPVDCEMGTVCFIQNYVDRDSGPLARDYACGLLTYDGHRGTDFRVADLATMRQGIAVIAAAPGTVRGTRDEMPDTGIRRRGDPSVKGRECGNGVVLDHGGGWVSQYCHLLQGSVAVTPGQQVEAGAMLGLIGQSGEAMFPHVHFEVRKGDTVVDPFAGVPAARPCGSATRSMWTAEAANALGYRETGLLRAGFSTAPPELDEVLNGEYAATVLPADAPALLLWALVYGLHAGDVEIFRIVGPDDKAILNARVSRADRHKAQWLSHVGSPLKSDAWPAGTYRGEYRIERTVAGKPQVVLEVTRELVIR